MLRLDAGHHTLTCGTCGAPLNKLKSVPVPPPVRNQGITHQPARPSRARPADYGRPEKVRYAEPPKRYKKRKGLFRKIAEEAFDLLEDIFD